jgi:serine/threonine protein kinase
MTSPQRLGKYELVEELGKGAMGVVYKAFDPDIHRTVAIKTTRKELVEDDDHADMMMARFRNEARAAGRLSHPGIVAVYDYGESSAVTYIAMEFVQGASLREYFSRGTRFAERDIVSIMAQLLDALDHAHGQGVWHRDIKPANLIVMNSGRIKIADFGIARIDTAQLTLTGIVMGSPGYMAPEQYTGGTVDWRADLFAAGVVMYQLLTGSHAFSGTTEQVAYKICHEQAPSPSAADPGRGWERYDAVIARALAKEPAKRFATADAFRAAILEVHAAPVSATVSAETIISEATVPAVFEPSDPTLDSPGPPGSRPGGEPQHDTVVLATRPPVEGTGIRRKWPFAAVTAMLALAIVAGMLFRRTADVPPASPTKARLSAKLPASPAADVERSKAETSVAAPPTAATAAPAPKPEPRPPPVRAEPPRKATASNPPIAAASEPGRKGAAASTPSKATVREPERKLAGAATSPRPAAAREPERRVAAATAPPKPAPKDPERKVAPAATPPKPPAKEPERNVAAASSPPTPKPASAPPPAQSGGYWTDQGVTLRVQSRLQFSRSMWNANEGIVVAVRNGVVTLTGTVPTPEDVAEAERLAATVAGVRAVRNQLKVARAQ